MSPALCYIAGPITIPDSVHNTHDAILVADRLYAEHSQLIVPLVPHCNLVWHLICPHPADYWYSYDFHLLERCDALLRLPGESVGADAEVAFAVEHGLFVAYDEVQLLRWAVDR